MDKNLIIKFQNYLKDNQYDIKIKRDTDYNGSWEKESFIIYVKNFIITVEKRWRNLKERELKYKILTVCDYRIEIKNNSNEFETRDVEWHHSDRKNHSELIKDLFDFVKTLYKEFTEREGEKALNFYHKNMKEFEEILDKKGELNYEL